MKFEFDPGERIERAYTLPAKLYTGRAVLDQEKARIFYETWQYVGRIDQIPGPGCYFTTEVVGEPLIIAKDKAGTLRGFHNVCRHRAGPVAQGAGCRASFQCGYHGWTYALDGRLIGTPEFDGVECFNKDEVGLAAVQVDVWENLIFAKLGAPPNWVSNPTLLEFLGDIPLKTEGLHLAAMSRVERRDYLVDCNWKTYVDNYLEGYHIPIVHPSLMRELDYNAYATTTGRYHSLQYAPIRSAKPGEATGRRYTAEEEQTEALYFWIFP
ncbi:MAG TPA: aromatic ring-hydroxylating dioxygenase subunit alpha, partial [Blastocatellia bacterium]|nr:aromatic ring-hydroxylating dioxygenase subunit alpha [Blastocatellia bacterium]